jgi:hypothetical protein
METPVSDKAEQRNACCGSGFQVEYCRAVILTVQMFKQSRTFQVFRRGLDAVSGDNPPPVEMRRPGRRKVLRRKR